MTLAAGTVVDYLVARGLVPGDAELTVQELAGGVSGTVLAVRGPGIALVVKQALPRLRVAEEWLAPARRTDTEAAALRLAARLVPGRVPPVVDSDDAEHVLVLQHAPAGWRNWQSELLAGRPHAASGRWAGETLGRLHAATADDADVAQAFADYEAFAQLRLDPYHGVVMERLPRARSGTAAADRGAAQCAHVPRARRLRTKEHPARQRRRMGAGRRGCALWAPGLRPRVLPGVPAPHGTRAPGSGSGVQRARAGLHGRIRAPLGAHRGDTASRWPPIRVRCCSRARTDARRRRSSAPARRGVRALSGRSCCSIRRPTSRR